MRWVVRSADELRGCKIGKLMLKVRLVAGHDANGYLIVRSNNEELCQHSRRQPVGPRLWAGSGTAASPQSPEVLAQFDLAEPVVVRDRDGLQLDSGSRKPRVEVAACLPGARSVDFGHLSRHPPGGSTAQVEPSAIPTALL